MALIQVNFMSESLMRTVPVQVILPIDKPRFPGMPEKEARPFKTLYLLHGVFGNNTDWVAGTCVKRWAEEKDLAVVMPSGENMFYVDQEKAHNYYGEYIGKELVEITRKMFPLSDKREDTFIAGLSMGGYGAVRNGLKYHDTFGCIGGFSSAFSVLDADQRTNDSPFFLENRDYAESFFGDLSKLLTSDKNPKWLIDKLKEEQAKMPKVYMACGKQDSLLYKNREMKDYMKNAGMDVTYEEGEGGHEWDFWNRYIKRFIDWLPMEEDAVDGINSGNVGI